MNPLKEKLVQFAASIGFKINEDAISEISTNESYDMAFPDNWDEMSEEEQMAWKDKHKQTSQNTSDSEPEPKPVKANAQKAQIPETLMQLNSLIEEMGGMDAFKGLLLSAVESVEVMQQNREVEKANLIAALVTNSNGALTEADLQDMEITHLQTMAKVLTPAEQVNYSMLGAGNIQHNADEIAPMPTIMDLVTNHKED